MGNFEFDEAFVSSLTPGPCINAYKQDWDKWTFYQYT